MSSTEAAELKRRIERLSAERITLFASAGAGATLSEDDRTRLKAIERELDECFVALRRTRAVRDARRFVGEDPVVRTRIRPRPPA